MKNQFIHMRNTRGYTLQMIPVFTMEVCPGYCFFCSGKMVMYVMFSRPSVFPFYIVAVLYDVLGYSWCVVTFRTDKMCSFLLCIILLFVSPSVWSIALVQGISYNLEFFIGNILVWVIWWCCQVLVICWMCIVKFVVYVECACAGVLIR